VRQREPSSSTGRWCSSRSRSTSHERQVAAGVCLFAGAFMVITGTLRVLS
jgi:hypothetical protein